MTDLYPTPAATPRATIQAEDYFAVTTGMETTWATDARLEGGTETLSYTMRYPSTNGANVPHPREARPLILNFTSGLFGKSGGTPADTTMDYFVKRGICVVYVETRGTNSATAPDSPFNASGDTLKAKAIRAVTEDMIRAFEFFQTPAGRIGDNYLIDPSAIFLRGFSSSGIGALLACLPDSVLAGEVKGRSLNSRVAGIITEGAAFGALDSTFDDPIRAIGTEDDWVNGSPPICWFGAEDDGSIGATRINALEAVLDDDLVNNDVHYEPTGSGAHNTMFATPPVYGSSNPPNEAVTFISNIWSGLSARSNKLTIA